MKNEEKAVKFNKNFMGQYYLEDYKLSLIGFKNNMSRYHQFLNQNKTIDKLEVLNKLNIIKCYDENEYKKKEFLSTFAHLIISNGYNFDDFLIQTDDSSLWKSINFEITNIKTLNTTSDFISKEANIKFTLLNNKELVLKYQYNDNWLEELINEYHHYIFVNCRNGNKIYSYSEKYNHDNKFRILLNDLFQYLEFLGENYYNIEFSKDAFWGSDDDTTLLKHCSFLDFDWQIEKKNIKYEEDKDRDSLEKIDINDILQNEDLTDEYIFDYCYQYYNKRIRYYGDTRINKEAFLIVDILDRLIGNNFPMAYIFKTLLHLDGILIFKDANEVKKLLKIAYSLGIKNPTIKIWNENNLDFINNSYSGQTINNTEHGPINTEFY